MKVQLVELASHGMLVGSLHALQFTGLGPSQYFIALIRVAKGELHVRGCLVGLSVDLRLRLRVIPSARSARRVRVWRVGWADAGRGWGGGPRRWSRRGDGRELD